MEPWYRSVIRFVQAEPQELRPLAWSFGYFFCLLCGYYILRPVRDEMAIQGGVHNLPWMMTGTFLTLLAVTPLFGWLSARYSRYRLLLAVYLFFIANLIGLYLLMTSGLYIEWVARGFFVWLSVFNLLRRVGVLEFHGRSVYTGAGGAPLRNDCSRRQHRRLVRTAHHDWPYLSVPGAGADVGLGRISHSLPRMHLPIRNVEPQPVSFHRENSGAPLGGGFLAGVRLVWSSPYLLGICGYLTFLTMTATFLYVEQVRLVAQQFDTPEARTRLFSMLDFATNILTWVTQLLLTNRVVARFGLAAALLFLPAVSLLGFLGIALWPGLVVYVSFSVLRRVGEYALSKPAREVLFTVVSREEKYKAKNFIDTAISRAGDASTGWLVSGLKALSVTTAQIAWVLVPLMVLWGWLGRWLAAQQGKQIGPG
ncbi:MAG: hypothetical protein QM771_15370 [Nitrospira sp.]